MFEIDTNISYLFSPSDPFESSPYFLFVATLNVAESSRALIVHSRSSIPPTILAFPLPSKKYILIVDLYVFGSDIAVVAVVPSTLVDVV